jgi:hypothetical protein
MGDKDEIPFHAIEELHRLIEEDCHLSARPAIALQNPLPLPAPDNTRYTSS